MFVVLFREFGKINCSSIYDTKEEAEKVSKLFGNFANSRRTVIGVFEKTGNL